MALSDTDYLHLSRAEARKLIEDLRRIPAIAEQLAITRARQGRVGRTGLATTRRPARLSSQSPIHLGAYLAGEALLNTLGTWVRLVCEQRALEFMPIGYVPAHTYGPLPDGISWLPRGYTASLLDLARWLDRNVIALSLTEGAETALEDIHDAVEECARQIDLPPEDEIVIDSARLRAANNTVLTAYQVEKIAGKLGEIGRGLNRDRVRYLAKHGLRECARDGETKFYRLGDVLVAHMQRQAKGSAVAPVE